MTISGGAHFSIDGVLFQAAIDQESHYQPHYESLFAPTSAIAGEVAKDNIRPEKIIWSITDWSGGEGATVYYPNNPTQYDQALGMNVTKRGQLTTRTERRRSAVARAGTNADAAKRPVGGSAYTHALIAWEDNILASADAITFSAAQDTSPAMSGHNYHDAISDGTNIAFLHDAFTTTNVVPVVSADASTTTWLDTESATTAQGGATDIGYVGAVLDGVPYSFIAKGTSGGLVLYKKAAVMDSAADWGATTIYNTGIEDVGTWGTNYWTACTAAESAIFMSYSTKTHSFVWEVRNDVGRPFYTSSDGFAVKELVYKSGILFMLGNITATGNTFAEIRAIPLTTGQVIEGVAEPRRHQNTSLSTFDVGCPGNGAYIFAANRGTGKIFLYDIRNDALSLFDDLVNGGTGDGVDFVSGEDNIAFLAMHGSRLFTATFNTADTGVTSLQVISWDDLEVQNRDDSQAISANLETPFWDFGLPMETKRLGRIIVNFKVTGATTSGLVANSRITISYSADDASYVDTTTITSATTPSGVKGRVVIAAPVDASTVLFGRLKVKITLDNNSQAVAPPILYSVIVEAEPAAWEQTWDLALRIEDETNNERPTTRQETAHSIATRLKTIKTSKEIFTFLDGFSDKANNSYTTHSVVMDDLHFDLRADGTGVARVRLRAMQS